MDRCESEWREVRRKERTPKVMEGIGRTDWARVKPRVSKPGVRQGKPSIFYFRKLPPLQYNYKGSMESGESEWREVRRKERKPKVMEGIGRTDWARVKPRVSEPRVRQGQPVTSYYFTEFPENYGAKQMHGVFMKYGWVDEVVIPSRRDKLGRRYGFVRFFNVKDSRQFAIELDNIIIGRQKLYVNLPRFARENYKKKQEACVGTGSGAAKHHTRAVNTWRQRQKGTMYANIVKGGGAPKVNKKKTTNREVKWRQQTANIEFKTRGEMQEKMNNAFVGEMVNPGASYLLQEEFHRQGIFDVKVTPMGVNLALMEEADLKGANEEKFKS